MKGVQCYELFGGIALYNHTFSLLSIKQTFNLAFIYIYAYLIFDIFPLGINYIGLTALSLS